MPEISRDEVAHLATLARIDLDDAELDHLAPQLSVILESVASISGVAGDDVPPTSHPMPLTATDTPGCWVAGRRLVAIDGTCLDLPDTAANDSHFGRPGVNKGERSAFPQARVVALAECGTHAMFEAVIGPYTASEAALSVELLGRLRPGMLCLADRGFYSFRAWETACGTGADLLWRVKDNLILEGVKDLPDGSWLADVFDSVADRRRQHPARVRVIGYTIEDGRDPTGPFRLITTVLDHRKAPAAQYRTRPALEVTRAGHPGDLGPPVLPLRDPVVDVRRRRARRTRPRPCLVRRRAARLAQVHRPTGRFSPLGRVTRSGGSGVTPSASSSAGSCPDGDPGPTPAWSNARTPSGTSNDPATTPGPNPIDHPNSR